MNQNLQLIFDHTKASNLFAERKRNEFTGVNQKASSAADTKHEKTEGDLQSRRDSTEFQ